MSSFRSGYFLNWRKVGDICAALRVRLCGAGAGPAGARIDPFSYSYEINVADNPFNWLGNSAGHSYHQDYKPQQQMLDIITYAYNKLYGNDKK